MKKMNLIRKINVLSWIVIAIILIIWTYGGWSVNGHSSIKLSVNIIINGSFCIFMGYIIDSGIKKYFEEEDFFNK